LLASWRVRIDFGELQYFAQQETIMALPQAFLEWEQQTQTRSREEGREEALLSSSLRASLESQLPTATLAFLIRLSVAIDETLRASGDFSDLESRIH
jgi:hypothetical protein